MKKPLFSLLLLFFISALYAQTENHPLLLGNPSGAVTSLDSPENYLLEKDEYVLSYNNSTLIPNWVAWHLSKEDLGDAARGNKFKPDPELPAEWYKVTAQDYQYNAYGFDRGHVCPSADRTSTQAANDVTFLMTNMIPQAPDLNRIVWMHLENYERELVNQGNEVYIFAGPAGTGGIGNRGIFEEINLAGNEQKIKVPEWSWKVLVYLPQGQDDFARIQAGAASVIAVCIPNRQGCQFDQTGNKIDWQSYLCSIDYIEELTGYDFLNLLPLELQQEMEK